MPVKELSANSETFKVLSYMGMPTALDGDGDGDGGYGLWNLSLLELELKLIRSWTRLVLVHTIILRCWHT